VKSAPPGGEVEEGRGERGGKLIHFSHGRGHLFSSIMTGSSQKQEEKKTSPRLLAKPTYLGKRKSIDS